jgi:hypothetical protein
LKFPPVDFTHCNSAYDTEFDENYAAPESVVQDPTRLAEMTAHHARRAAAGCQFAARLGGEAIAGASNGSENRIGIPKFEPPKPLRIA